MPRVWGHQLLWIRFIVASSLSFLDAMFAKVAILLAASCCVVLADRNPFSYRPPSPPPSNSYNAPRPAPRPAPSRYDSREASFEDPKYDFQWQVNEDYNNFRQEETRDNDNTQGSYTVALPDGRTQRVTYYVDGDSGFVAEVSYSGEARYPDSREYSAPAPQRPSYTTPRPAYRPPTTTRRPAYRAPTTTRRPSYNTTPRPTYRAPRPSPPRNSYSAPNSLLSAFGF